MKILGKTQFLFGSTTHHYRILGFLLVMVFSVTQLKGQDLNSYQAADSITYKLYEQGNWTDLIKQGNFALSEGHDYYYMRMRVGIAYYMIHRYRCAVEHFEKALVHNSLSNIAYDYLKLCYEWGGMETEAATLKKRFSNLAGAEELKSRFVKGISLYAGGAFSGSSDKFFEIDLDGEANLYGEIIGNGDAFYTHAGINIAPAKQFSWYFGYTLLRISKHQRIFMPGYDTLSNNYRLVQNQFFFSAPINLKRGWHLTPAFNFITMSEQPYIVDYDTVQFKYNITKLDTTLTSYLISLRVIKNMPHFMLGLAAGNSNLNNATQWQGTLIAGWYPFANLNQYLILRSSLLFDDGNVNQHFRVIAGSKVFSILWLQGSFHVGNLKNSHDENGLLVYNTSGKITSRRTATAFVLLTENLTLQIDYSFVKQQDNYLEYIDSNTFALKPVNYNNHHIMGGLKWKL